MNKKILSGLVLVLGVVILVAWEGNGVNKEVKSNHSQKNEKKRIEDVIYVIEPEIEIKIWKQLKMRKLSMN
ncbi:hypothetical protein MHI18_16370 [Peribacillus sp. FSL H8-0477]|uniref:hypothetical protein n=1 Tax=Peribacillus sp. FSL H8-0477 TaxID=2921388 RepID=UPI0030F57C44